MGNFHSTLRFANRKIGLEVGVGACCSSTWCVVSDHSRAFCLINDEHGNSESPFTTQLTITINDHTFNWRSATLQFQNSFSLSAFVPFAEKKSEVLSFVRVNWTQLPQHGMNLRIDFYSDSLPHKSVHPPFSDVKINWINFQRHCDFYGRNEMALIVNLNSLTNPICLRRKPNKINADLRLFTDSNLSWKINYEKQINANTPVRVSWFTRRINHAFNFLKSIESGEL